MIDIIKTAFPILFSSMMSLFVLMVNMRIVGRDHPENIYILGVFTSVSYLVLALFESFRALIISNIVKYKNLALLTEYLNSAILLSSFLFIILCISMWILKFNIFTISMIAASMVGSWSYILVSAIYVFQQRMVALILVQISAVLNISQVYLYFNYSDLGIFCIPISILVTNIIVCLYAARWMGYKNYLTISLFKICIRDYIYQGMPVFMSYMGLFIGVFWFNQVLSKAGFFAVSGFGIAYRLQMMAMLLSIAIGSAMAIINNKKEGLILCFVSYLAIVVIIFFSKNSIVSFMTNNAFIAQQANHYLSIVSPTYLFFSLFLCSIIYFEQTGRGFLGLVFNAAYFALIYILQAYVGLYPAIALINVLSFFAIIPFIFYSKGSDYVPYRESIA